MHSHHCVRFVSVILLAAFFTSITGCASFISREYPEPAYKFKKSPQISADYDIKSYTANRPIKEDNMCFSEESLERHISIIATQSNLFSDFGSGIGHGDYHFSYSLDINQYYLPGILSALFCGLTLTVLPAYSPVDYTLSVDVTRSNQLFKRYEYKCTVSTWVQMFLIFKTLSHSPWDVKDQALDEMLRAFLHDFQKDVVSQPGNG